MLMKKDIRVSYLKKCFDMLDELVKSEDVDTPILCTRIKRFISLIQKLLYESEEEGNFGLLSHESLKAGE